MKLRRSLLLWIPFSLVVGCSSAQQAPPEAAAKASGQERNMDAKGFPELFGKTWTLAVEEHWDSSAEVGQPQFPHDELPAEAYQSVQCVGPCYELSFADDGKHVEVQCEGSWDVATEDVVGGSRGAGRKTELHYDLHRGLFAGGRLVVTIDNGTYRGELTIYGSGLPILASERGTVSPN